jgi:hypothetical protein
MAEFTHDTGIMVGPIIKKTQSSPYAVVTRDAAHRSPSALLRAMSLSNGSWTFYEATKDDQEILPL